MHHHWIIFIFFFSHYCNSEKHSPNAARCEDFDCPGVPIQLPWRNFWKCNNMPINFICSIVYSRSIPLIKKALKRHSFSTGLCILNLFFRGRNKTNLVRPISLLGTSGKNMLNKEIACYRIGLPTQLLIYYIIPGKSLYVNLLHTSTKFPEFSIFHKL